MSFASCLSGVCPLLLCKMMECLDCMLLICKKALANKQHDMLKMVGIIISFKKMLLVL
jgi:hypothetical protein